MKEADDGDHFRLAFDRAGSWSQKYNLVWDRLLGLNLFPAEVARKEMAFYRKTQNRYGLPLDNRKEYTKLDWILWTATLTRDRADFEALVAPVYRFLNETPDRSPMTDWYETVEPKKVGFTARPVVGGVFVELLYDKALWRKYARRDTTKAAGWAPMPALPQITPVVPAADVSSAIWKYTTSRPEAAWVQPRFDDRSWQEGRSGFGSPGTPGAVIGTRWTSREIWLRREFVLPEGSATSNLQGWLHHDEDAEVYINGLLAVSASDFVSGYDAVPLTTSALSTLRTGTNVVAIRCRQTSGGQYIDFGLVRVE